MAKNIYCATPYDTSAPFFYFSTFEEYQEKSSALRNSYGQPVEEFMIDYIEGDLGELFRACSIDQSNLEHWFDKVENLRDNEQIALFYLMTNNVCSSIEEALAKIDDVCLYEGNIKTAAVDYFDECFLNEIPEYIQGYIDYDRFARDLQVNGDVSEFVYRGTTYTCTNANSI